MLRNSEAFAGFSVDDIDKAEAFYGETLGLDVQRDDVGLTLRVKGGSTVFVYGKDNHEPATYTVLNFPVSDIDGAVDELRRAGVSLEHYGEEFGQDERGVARSEYGPPMAWFKDPAGNVLSIIETG